MGVHLMKNLISKLKKINLESNEIREILGLERTKECPPEEDVCKLAMGKTKRKDLIKHVNKCPYCNRAYFDYLEINNFEETTKIPKEVEESMRKEFNTFLWKEYIKICKSRPWDN
jgi:hypothetical protein